MSLKTIHKWIVYLLLTYAIIAYAGGFPPFEETVLNKDFYPSGSLKYATIFAVSLLLLSFWILSTRYVLLTDDMRVLLAKS